MSIRLPAVVASCAVVALLAGAAMTTTATAGDDDLPSSASPLVPGANAGEIDPAGDQDWYVLRGGRPEPASIALTALGSDCGDAQLLTVELFNPEGRWMRTQILSTTAGVELAVPRFAGRYTLRIAAVNPSCSGLAYVVRFGDCAAATTAECAFRPTTAECRKATADRALAVGQGITGSSPQARRHRRLYEAATKVIKRRCR